MEPTPVGEAIMYDLTMSAAASGWVGYQLLSEGEDVKKEEKVEKDDDEKTAQEIISKEKRGSINRKFPEQWRYKKMKEIKTAKRDGDRSAIQAYKLLKDNRFNK